jgi:hypothetical protein
MIAVVGYDCGQLSWRQILERFLFKCRHDWDQTSLLASLFFNRGQEERRQKTPDFFNPYRKTSKRGGTMTLKAGQAENESTMKAAFGVS